MRATLKRFDIRVSLVYAVVAVLWIIFSDKLISSIFGGNKPLEEIVDTLKGMGFVAVTTLVLFAVLSAELRKRVRAEQELAHDDIILQQSEAARSASKEQLRLFVEHAPAAIAMLDTDMKYLLVSQRWLYDFHLKESNVIGRSHYEIFPDLPEQWIKIHQRCLNGEVASSDADPFPRADGSMEWVQWEIRPWRHDSGEIGGIFIFSELITERIQAQTVIQRFAERMEILHEIDQGIIGATSIQEVGDAAIRNVRKLIPCQRANVIIIDEKTREGVIFALDTSDDTSFKKGFRVPITPEMMQGYDARNIRVVDDLTPMQATNPHVKQLMSEGIISYLNVKLLDHGRPIGIMSLQANTTAFFTPEYQEIAAEIANQLAIAIHQLHLTEELSRHTDQLEQLVVERTVDVRAAKRHVEGILNNSADGILLAHADFTIRQTNTAFNSLLACQNDDYFDQPLTALFPANEHDRLMQTLQHGSAEGSAVTIDVKTRRRDDSLFDAEISVGFIEGDGMVCTIRDITERKIQERQLRYYASVQENLSDAVITSDLEFQIQAWNKAAERVYGWSAEEIVGKKVEDVLQTHFESDAARQQFRQNFFNHGHWNGELIQHRKDGSEIHLLGSITLLKDEHNTPFGVVSVIHDITERKAQERLLRFNASVQDNLSDAVIVTDVGMRIQSWNKAAERIYGWTADEVIGKTTAKILQTKFFPPETTLNSFHKLREEGWWQTEFIQTDKAGNPHYMLGAVTMVKGDDGKPFGVVAVNHDITERKQAEEALQKSAVEIHDLYNNAPCGYHSLDENGIIIQMNDTELFWLGYTRDEVVGKLKVSDLYTPDSQQIFHESFPLFKERGWINDLQLEVIRKDGSVINTLMSATAIYDEQGRFVKSRSTLFDISDLTQAQKELSASESRYRLLAENVIDVIAKSELDGVITYITPSIQAALGYSPEELLGRNVAEIVHPDDLETTLSISLEAITSAKASFRLIQRIRHQDGHYIPVEITNSIVRDPNTGMPLEYIGVMRDISERMKAEDALRESEARHRFLAENVSDVIMRIDADGIRTFITPSCYTLLGYQPEELVGKPNLEIVHPDDLSGVQRRMRQIMSTSRSTFSFTQRVQHKRGRYIWVEVTSSVVRDPVTGNPVEMIGVMRDITERKQNEDALRESESRYRLLAENVSDVIRKNDPSGIITFITPSCHATFGYAPGEMIGKHTTDFIHPDDLTGKLAAIEGALDTSESQYDHTFRIRHKSGQYIWVEGTTSIIRDPDSRAVIEFVSVIRDISARKEAEEKLNQKLAQEEEMQLYLKRLHEISILLTQTTSLDDFFRCVVEQGLHQLGFERMGLLLYDPQAEKAIGTYGTDELGNLTDEHHIRIDTGGVSSTLHRVLEQRERVIWKENTQLFTGTLGPLDMGSHAVAALWHGTLMGWLSVDNAVHHRPISQVQLDILALYALTASSLLAHKQTEFDLRTSEERYRFLGENVSDVISRITPEGVRTFITSSCYPLLGYMPDEMVGAAVFDSVHPDDRENTRSIMLGAVHSSEPTFVLTQRMRHKAGHYVWVEVKGSIIRDISSNKALEIVAVVRDISERMKADEALRSSEMRYRQMFEHNQAIKLLIDPQTAAIVDANPAACDYYGYSLDTLRTMHITDINILEENQVLADINHAQTEAKTIFEFRHRLANGEIRDVEVYTGPIELEGKNLLFSIIMDITERKCAEAALNAQMEEDREFQIYLKALHEINIELTQIDDLDTFYRRAVELGLEKLGFERLALFLYDEADGSAIGTYGTNIQGQVTNEHGLKFAPDPQGVISRALERTERFYFTDNVILYNDLQAVGIGWNAAAVLWNAMQSLGWLVADNVLTQAPASKPLLEALSLYAMTIGTLLAQKQTQIALQESEYRYRLLADTINDVVMRFSTQMDYLYVSPSSRIVMGYEPEELIGPANYERIHPDDAPAMQALVKGLIENPGPGSLTYRFQHKDGHYIWLETSGQTVVSPETGEALEFILSARDITQRKAAEDAVRESESRYRLLAENITDVVMRSNMQGQFVYMSPSSRAVLGYEPEELLGQTASSFIHPDDIAEATQLMMEAMRQNTHEVTIIGRFRHKQGHYIWLESVGRAMISEETGQFMEFISSARDISDRKRAEDALRESEERFRQIAENFDQVLFIRSGDNKELLYINPRYEEIWGRSSDSLYQNPNAFMEFVHPDDLPILRREFSNPRYVEHGIADFEYRVILDDQQTHWLRVRTFPIKNEQDVIILRAGILEDISERKLAETAIRESEEKFRLLLDAAPVATVISDETGHIAIINGEAEKLFGYTRDELIGQRIEMLVPEQARSLHIHSREKYMTAPRVRRMNGSMEFFAKHKDEHLIPVEIELSVIQTKDGIMVMSFIVDITERKRIAAELESQRSFLQNVIDVSPSAIFVKDYDSRFVLANPTLAQLYGVPAEEIIGKKDADFHYASEEIDEFLKADRHVITSGESLFFEEQLTDVNGHARWFQTTKVPIVSGDGQAKYVLGVATDITERKRAEDMLRQALEHEKELGELKSRLVSMASHEFRTPLASIMSSSEILLRYRAKYDGAQIDEKLNGINYQVKHLNTIVEDVLNLGRIESGRIEYHPVDLEFDEFCRFVIGEFQNRPDISQNVVYEVSQPGIHLRLDETLTRQILTNLITNAIKYSPLGRSVWINLDREGDYAVLSVRDEGIGIPEADINRLFQPFHRAKNVGTISGTGLGLAITKEAVELHGGTITVESTVDVGTTFYVRFPLNVS